MGEQPNQPFQHSFNPSLRVDFPRIASASDGGQLLVREFDERLYFGELISEHVTGGARGQQFLGVALGQTGPCDAPWAQRKKK